MLQVSPLAQVIERRRELFGRDEQDRARRAPTKRGR
jgi:hypothetical protein